MISVQEAVKLVLEQTQDFGTEYLSLERANGRTLAEILVADRDMPPFNRVTMDGIAIRSAEFNQGQRIFRVENMYAAGKPQGQLSELAGAAAEIMTGAIIPNGADAVIKYEDIRLENGQAHVQLTEVFRGQNIHVQGEDARQGQELVPPGQNIGLAEIGVAASIGKSKLLVKKLPRVAIVSTGDEVIPVESQPHYYQIRQSNGYVLSSICHTYGLMSDRWHLPDDEATIINHLQKLILDYDVILLSGGVSKGKLDFVPPALNRLGVKKVFHQVAQRPGKPFWFGRSTEKGTFVFAFPGNPVSITVCALVYFVPWLERTLCGKVQPRLKVSLEQSVAFKPDLDYFAPARIRLKENVLSATVVPGHGSGDYPNLVGQHGFVHLPQGKSLYPVGEIVEFIPYKNWYL